MRVAIPTIINVVAVDADMPSLAVAQERVK